MKAKYIQKGDAVDFVPTASVAAGEIVKLGNLIGVTKLDTEGNARGTISLNGVFDIAKAQGIAFTAGSNVFWDSQNKSAAATGTFVGLAIEAAPATADHVRILLNCNVNAASTGIDAEWQVL